MPNLGTRQAKIRNSTDSRLLYFPKLLIDAFTYQGESVAVTQKFKGLRGVPPVRDGKGNKREIKY